MDTKSHKGDVKRIAKVWLPRVDHGWRSPKIDDRYAKLNSWFETPQPEKYETYVFRPSAKCKGFVQRFCRSRKEVDEIRTHSTVCGGLHHPIWEKVYQRLPCTVEVQCDCAITLSLNILSRTMSKLLEKCILELIERYENSDLRWVKTATELYQGWGFYYPRTMMLGFLSIATQANDSKKVECFGQNPPTDKTRNAYKLWDVVRVHAFVYLPDLFANHQGTTKHLCAQVLRAACRQYIDGLQAWERCDTGVPYETTPYDFKLDAQTKLVIGINNWFRKSLHVDRQYLASLHFSQGWLEMCTLKPRSWIHAQSSEFMYVCKDSSILPLPMSGIVVYSLCPFGTSLLLCIAWKFPFLGRNTVGIRLYEKKHLSKKHFSLENEHQGFVGDESIKKGYTVLTQQQNHKHVRQHGLLIELYWNGNTFTLHIYPDCKNLGSWKSQVFEIPHSSQ